VSEIGYSALHVEKGEDQLVDEPETYEDKGRNSGETCEEPVVNDCPDPGARKVDDVGR